MVGGQNIRGTFRPASVLLMLKCLTAFKGSELEPAFHWKVKTEAQFEFFCSEFCINSVCFSACKFSTQEIPPVAILLEHQQHPLLSDQFNEIQANKRLFSIL